MSSLKKNFSWTFLANLIQAACQWAIIAVVARYSSTTDVGIIALGLALAGPVFMFTDLQLRSVILTDVNKQNSFESFVALRIITSLIAFILLLGLSYLSTGDLYVYLVVVCVFIFKLFESLSDIVNGKFQSENLHNISAKLTVIRSLITTTVFAAVFILSGKLLIATALWAISNSLLWFILDLSSVTQMKLKILVKNDLLNRALRVPLQTPEILFSLMIGSLPLGFITLFISLRSNIPRYYVDYMEGATNLGIFAAIAYLVAIGGRVVNALGTAATPRLALLITLKRYREFHRLVLIMLFSSLLIGVVGLIISNNFGYLILEKLYSKEYAKHYNVLSILILASSLGFATSFLGYGLTAARIFTSQLVPTILVCIVVGIFSGPLILNYGLIGASYSVLCGELVGLISFIYLYMKKLYFVK